MRINKWFPELADWIIKNGLTPSWMYAASLHFKVSEEWIAMMWSDAFRDYYLRRQGLRMEAIREGHTILPFRK